MPLVLLALSLLAGCSLWSARGDQPEQPAPAPTLGALQRLAPAEVAPAPGAVRAATRIERVTVETEPDGSRVILDLDGFAEPEVSLLVNQRLVIDVPGTSCQALAREIDVPGDPLVERVRTGQHAAPAIKSRVVIDLRGRTDFAVRAQNGRIVVLLAPGSSSAAGAAEQSATSRQVLLRAEPPGPTAADTSARATRATPAPLAAATPAPEPTAETAAPTPVLASPEPSPTAAPTPATAASVVLDTAATRSASAGTAVLPTAIESPRPTGGATAAPIQPDDTASSDLAPTPRGEPSAEVALATEAAQLPPSTLEPERTPPTQGKRISIDFSEADVRTVLELIASAGGYQVIFTPDVGGVITITLVDLPWEDALDKVLRAKLLREVRHEDVMLVSPIARPRAGTHH